MNSLIAWIAIAIVIFVFFATFGGIGLVAWIAFTHPMVSAFIAVVCLLAWLLA